MSDTLSTEVKPIKNAYGLPTGERPLEGLNPDPPAEEVVEEIEEVVEEEVQYEEEPVEPEQEEITEEEDFLALTLGTSEPEPVSEESEVDRLRREVDVLKGHLEAHTQSLDKNIKEEAKEVEDEDLDWSNPQFVSAINEKLQENPDLLTVLMNEMIVTGKL